MLTLRELNRATLARQHLLRRHQGGVTSVVHRLAGLQAQEPRPPYLGMWTRLDGFARDDLHAALRARTLVRATMMRATLHLVTAADFAAFRPLLHPLLAGAARRFPEIDFDAVAVVAERLLAEGPHTFNELRPRLENEFPGAYDRALGYAVRMLVPLIMVPTEDQWSFPRESAFALPGIEPAAEPDLGTFVERYLAAFGPATVADMQTWSGLTGLKSVMNGMRDRLEVLVDERGKELFDLPEAPRPEGDMPAPVRFLPDFDNLMLGHADRTRVLPEEYRGQVVTKNLRVRATYLVDGFVAGTWQIKRTGRKAKLLITPFTPVSPEVLEEEGMALLAFAEPDAEARSLEVMS
ncbi:winged helix DNA-binding domain-containing protein [Nonomuraea sp. NEAU-A123]|uniref:winged helix DNA-binding domain-containing protein n=1 Tax=Nonomuraea sp. NEAU-A123 TaxID=2839649 RepID=UPI001BE477BA|nr:winged helix DNA-binding domain-containing protein [Nonomuraea sp. NEAU-A123]MBT2227566.1 winged helix DNA-binding domain-containing protein [Nonomuraea sp. NEAU-A123]